MLGNNEHFYPGQDDGDGEDEEEEEEQGTENETGRGGCDTHNGGVEADGGMTGGRQTWDSKGGEVVKPAAIVVGRQRADRPLRPAHLTNRGVAPTHQQTAGKHHTGLNALSKRRALMERSMTTAAPLGDAFPTMMVFRIGIPDIKQTVGSSETHVTVHSPSDKKPDHMTGQRSTGAKCPRGRHRGREGRNTGSCYLS